MTACGPDRLVLDHLDKVRRLARAFARRWPVLADEVEGAALVGLTEAARSCRAADRPRFWYYAAPRVYGAMHDELRRWAPAGYRQKGRAARAEVGPAPTVRHLSDLAAAAGSEDAAADPADLIADEDTGPVGWEAEYHDEVAALARRLTGRRAEVFLALYTRADCATGRGAGAALGLTDRNVFLLHFRAVRELVRGRDGRRKARQGA